VIAVVDHPQRTDSPAYTRSRALMQSLIATAKDWVLSGDQYQDHHGGSVWVKDPAGWLCLQLPLGIEWSSQFCADPAKVDLLRQYAGRVVAAFPQTLPGYESFGYHDGESLLSTPITDANGFAAWTDSIFNASYPARLHSVANRYTKWLGVMVEGRRAGQCPDVIGAPNAPDRDDRSCRQEPRSLRHPELAFQPTG
jgi:hypothetical protein